MTSTFKDLKKFSDKVYAIGFQNGQIDMKNKVLKLINRDYTVIANLKVETATHLLKKIDKIKLNKPSLLGVDENE